MNVPNVVPAGPGSPMTSWVQSDDGPHVVYADANGNLRQIWYTIQASANHAQGWDAQPLSNVENVVPAGLSGPMTSIVVPGDGPHVIYADANGNLTDLWYTISGVGAWQARSLMTTENVVAAGPGRAMTSWVQADSGPHFVYADANGNLEQMWFARFANPVTGTIGWAAESLMNVANVVAARPGGAMTSWEEWDDEPDAFYGGPHVVYVDANGNLQQIWSTAISGGRFYNE
jgi:hypothetical protein